MINNSLRTEPEVLTYEWRWSVWFFEEFYLQKSNFLLSFIPQTEPCGCWPADISRDDWRIRRLSADWPDDITIEKVTCLENIPWLPGLPNERCPTAQLTVKILQQTSQPPFFHLRRLSLWNSEITDWSFVSLRLRSIPLDRNVGADFFFLTSCTF